MVINSKGKLDFCPFRTRKVEQYNPIKHDNEVVEYFADCLKENCMCYQQKVGREDGEIIWVAEECYRDQLYYHREWNDKDLKGYKEIK